MCGSQGSENRCLTLSVVNEVHLSSGCSPSIRWPDNTSKSLTIWPSVRDDRKALDSASGCKALKHECRRCTQAPRPTDDPPTDGLSSSGRQQIRIRSHAGAFNRQATHLLCVTAEERVSLYSSNSTASVAASVHSPADTAGPPSAGFQTCSPLSSSTIHSPSAHSTSA